MKLLKNLYEINIWAVPITILICFTFWGGLFALPILGIIQIVMSIIMIIHFKKLTKLSQTLFIIYASLLLLIFILKIVFKITGIQALIILSITSIFLASFHLYITYNIYKGIKTKENMIEDKIQKN